MAVATTTAILLGAGALGATAAYSANRQSSAAAKAADQSRWPQPPASVTGGEVTSYENPQGTQTLVTDPVTGAKKWVYEESEATKATRLKRETLRSEILDTLGVVSGEREAQANEFAEEYQREFLKFSQPQLEQSLIGRGLGGSSIYQDAITDLFSNAARSSVLEKENLLASDERAKLAKLNAVEAGQNADVANQNFTANMASTDLARKQSLQQAYWQSQLGATLSSNQNKQNADSALMQSLMGSGSNMMSSYMMSQALTAGAAGACLPKGTKIELEEGGFILVEDIDVGQKVLGGTVIRTGKVDHYISNSFIEHEFDDNIVVVASAGHPFKSKVMDIRKTDRREHETYDILTSSGTYFINGVEVKSTLEGGIL